MAEVTSAEQIVWAAVGSRRNPRNRSSPSKAEARHLSRPVVAACDPVWICALSGRDLSQPAALGLFRRARCLGWICLSH